MCRPPNIGRCGTSIHCSFLYGYYGEVSYCICVVTVYLYPQICSMEFDRRDIPMNKLVVAGLESKFSVYDMRTQHPTKGFASLTETVSDHITHTHTCTTLQPSVVVACSFSFPSFHMYTHTGPQELHIVVCSSSSSEQRCFHDLWRWLTTPLEIVPHTSTHHGRTLNRVVINHCIIQ